MNPEPLELYIQVKTEMRQSKDAILAKHGISWAKWLDLCADVEAAFPDEGVIRDGYEFRCDLIDVEAYKKVDRKVVFQRKAVSLHKIRS